VGDSKAFLQTYQKAFCRSSFLMEFDHSEHLVFYRLINYWLNNKKTQQPPAGLGYERHLSSLTLEGKPGLNLASLVHLTG
jgi:hypothetical protein